MCNKAVDHCPLTLRFVSNHLKTKKMRERAVEVEPEALEFVPDVLKAQGVCERAVEDKPKTLESVPDCKTKRYGKEPLNMVQRWNLPRSL